MLSCYYVLHENALQEIISIFLLSIVTVLSRLPLLFHKILVVPFKNVYYILYICCRLKSSIKLKNIYTDVFT
jgi:hypothetical protein